MSSGENLPPRSDDSDPRVQSLIRIIAENPSNPPFLAAPVRNRLGVPFLGVFINFSDQKITLKVDLLKVKLFTVILTFYFLKDNVIHFVSFTFNL